MIHPNELPPGYKLIEPLGFGGNARVAHVKYGNDEFALKLLNNYKDPDSPTFRRFINEIGAMEQLHNDVGVMPILDKNLPKHPTKTNRPWFTMPVSTPIAKILYASHSLDSCVEALVDIANTLIRLKGRNIGHRDIKPDNLFRLEDSWVIGDFGLATLPNSEEGVTEYEGRPLGSRQFMAPEMSTNPIDASPFPADVWSLAKTLWSLATRNPHPSYLQFEPSRDGLEHYGIDDHRTHLIDRLLEHATARMPDDRITIEDFASELEKWLGLLNSSSTNLQVGDLAAKMSTLARPIIDKQLSQKASIDSSKEMMDAIGPRFVELRDFLAKDYGEHNSAKRYQGFIDKVRFGETGFIYQFSDAIKGDYLAKHEGYFTINPTIPSTCQLRFNIFIRVLPDLQHQLYALLVTNVKGRYEKIWDEIHTVPYGLPQEEYLLNELIDNMIDNTRPALVRLNELVASYVNEDSP